MVLTWDLDVEFFGLVFTDAAASAWFFFCSAKSPEGDGGSQSHFTPVDIWRTGQSERRSSEYITKEGTTPTIAPPSAKRFIIAHQLVCTLFFKNFKGYLLLIIFIFISWLSGSFWFAKSSENFVILLTP